MDLDRNTWKVRLSASISNLSRTSAGASSKAYKDKPSLLITEPEQLRKQTAENLEKAVEYVWNRGPAVAAHCDEVKAFVEGLADMVSDKLMGPGHRYRTWELDQKKYPNSLSPEGLPGACCIFYKTVASTLDDPDADLVHSAAYFERMYDSVIHPLPDGCGRVAKLIGAWILLRDRKYPALFENREEYYGAMKSSTESWETFYRSRLRQ